MIHSKYSSVGAKETIEFMKSLNANTEATIAEALEELSDIAEDTTRQVVLDMAYDTGRLAASIGHYKPELLTGQNPDPLNVSTKDDAYYRKPHKTGNTWEIAYGSNVPYALPVDQGFFQKMDYSRVVMIRPGEWRLLKNDIQVSGIYAFEKGFARIRPLMNLILGKKMKKAGWGAKFHYRGDGTFTIAK